MPDPSILIRTLPLEAGNYGGVLQGFALQKVLRRYSERVVTDLSIVPSLESSIVGALLPVKRLITQTPLFGREISDVIHAKLNAFISETMQTTRLFDNRRKPRARLLDNFDTVVVGGDQVWRAAYGNVASYLLDFLPADSSKKRISYAASFGVEDPNTLEGLRRYASLAQRFDAISVREDWGVAACAELWGVKSVRVLDPVLLLEADDYLELAKSVPTERGYFQSGVFAFLLDPDAEKVSAAQALAQHLGYTLTQFTPEPVPRLIDYRRRTHASSNLSMAEWISSLAMSDCVVTDSFHGVVLAILFNRPFVAIGNKGRGLGRFNSLLKLFGLQSHLRLDPTEFSDPPAEIDWISINKLIESERLRSIAFLEDALR